MQTYSKFQPTGFDPRGLALDDQQDWLVVPVAQNRDSGPLEQSNFASALQALGGESDDVQVHRFGHWACGWFEILIVNPANAKLVAIADDIERALSDYPVLDDEDFNQRESDEADEDWHNWARRDFIRNLESDFGLADSTADFLDDCDSDELRAFFTDHCREYIPINVRSFDCDRDELAQFIRQQRNKQPA